MRLRHYRSIADADVDLGRLLLLVGPNGSGKSNFLDALRLVSEALQTGLDQAIRARGGMAEMIHRPMSVGTWFSIELEFRWPDYTGKYGFIVSGMPGSKFGLTQERCRVTPIDATDEPGHDSYFETMDGEVTLSSLRLMPPISDQRLFLSTAAGLDEFHPVYEGLAGMTVFNLNPDVMRRPHTPDSGELLARDGSNAASVLRHLQDTPQLGGVGERIEDYLRTIVPGINGVTRSDLGSWETLTFTQSTPGSNVPLTFQAQSVSDGTLRATGVLLALFAGTGRTLSTVGIEEPESALHPAATAVLLDALRDASERRQVIVTSHSPDLLDRNDFTLDEIRAVRSIDGKTIIGPLDAAGSLALREELYTPGELLRRDQLLPETDRTA